MENDWFEIKKKMYISFDIYPVSVMLFSINYFRYIAAINNSQTFLSTIDGWLNYVFAEYDTVIFHDKTRNVRHFSLLDGVNQPF